MTEVRDLEAAVRTCFGFVDKPRAVRAAEEAFEQWGEVSLRLWGAASVSYLVLRCGEVQ
jgi:hypothetical protein